MPLAAGGHRNVSANHPDNRIERRAVIAYYDDCDDDYRILWRTNENGSIHFGFFDVDEQGSSVARLTDTLRLAPSYALGAAAAIAAGTAALLGGARGRAKSVDWLRVAARGDAAAHDCAQLRMTEECARAAALRPGETVLDAGCGVGGTGLALAAHCGVSVLGLNVQPRQLREARRRADVHPAGQRVRFSAQDFTQIGLAAETVEVVWALESVCHCSAKAAFIAEAHRILRPGGRLMVADFFQPRRGGDPEHRAGMRTWTQGWALPELADVPTFHELLREHGFRGVTYRDIGPHVLRSSRRLYKASLVAGPISAALTKLGCRSRIQHENVRAAYWQYRTLQAGAWTYGIFVAQK